MGQLLTFFGISLYVKLVEMRDTAEYGATWIGSGRLVTNCLHYVLFCGQEFSLFTGLLILAVAWQRGTPQARWPSRAAGWALALVVLPALSAIEVLGLAHFKLFLAPLGPEELRMVGWTGHIVTAGNVLHLPEVVAGLLLVLTAYHLAPPALWLPRIGGRRKAALVTVALLASVLANSVPKPLVTDALLTPHPLLWLLLGGRSGPAWTAAGVGAAPVVGHSGRGHLVTKGRPTNVLVFVLESTRAASLAVYKPTATAGRELLRFRDEMVVFDNVYAPVPTSAHAIFSILYGVYPYLGPFWTSTDASVVADSMAQLFARGGYATRFYITGDLNYDNVRSFAARGFEQVLDINDWPGQEAYAQTPWGRDDRLLTDEVKRFIAATPKRPFFVFAMTSNPHHPYAVDHLPPAPHGAAPQATAAQQGDSQASEWQAAYERLVDYDLHLLAELYEWLKETGVAERTLLLVLGDHGEAFGEHPGNFGHAAFIYEENLHVPCFILHPHRLGLPRHIAQLGSQVDLRATILDILGQRDSEPGNGMSLLSEDRGRMVPSFTENGVSRFGLRDARFTYIYTPHTDTEQVFDRSADPGETQNIAQREPGITTRYRVSLQRWEAQHQLVLAKILR